MKKTLVLVIAIVMCVAIFAACGTEAEAPAQTGDAAGEPASLEMFDAGNITIDVPQGWNAFPVADIFAEEENATDPDAVMVIKGGESEFDAFTKPYLQVNYYNPDETTMMTPDPTWYDDAQNLEAMAIGARTWEGFTAKSLDMPVAVLWTTDSEGNQFQVTMWTEVEGAKISVDDADVQAIIASIGVK